MAVFTPVWLPIAGQVLATLIGLHPVLRGATLAPVDALKYE